MTDISVSLEDARAAILPLVHGRPVVLAVSGGGDSAALLRLAAQLRPDLDLRLAVTVDHRLRDESAHEATAVAAWCADLGLPHEIKTWEGRKPPSGLPAAARAARYELLAAAARPLNAVIMTAHTLDDQAETVLLRLMRGSGVDGLAAMASETHMYGTSVLRPLLNVSRAQLRATLQAGGWPWFEDPSNDDPRYDRIKARRALTALAPLGLTAERLAKTAAAMARARTALEAATEIVLKRAVWTALGVGRIARSDVAAVEEDIALRAVSLMIQAAGGGGYPPNIDAISAALAWIIDAPPASARTLGGAILRLKGEDLILCREPRRALDRIKGDGLHLWDGRFRVCGPEGTHVAALGAVGDAALTRAQKQDRWTPAAAWRAAASEHRRAAPAFWRGDHLMAVPAAGWGDPRAAATFQHPEARLKRPCA